MGRAITRAAICMAALLLISAGAALADTTLTFVDGNTVSGSLVYDATTNTITSFDFTSTAWSTPTTPVTTVFENSGTACNVSQACSVIVTNQDGDEVLAFDGAEPSLGVTSELDLVLSCNGTADCLEDAAAGTSFALTAGAYTDCSTTATGFCIASGEQYSVPECLGSMCEDLLAGENYLQITDPSCPGTDVCYTLTLNTEALGTVFTGTTTPTPEPSSLLLFSCGLGGLFFLRKFRIGYRCRAA